MASSGAVRTLPTLFLSLEFACRRSCSGKMKRRFPVWIISRLETDIIMPPKMNEKLPVFERYMIKKRTFAHAAFAREDNMAGFSQIDSTGLSVGLKKGFVVEKRKLAARPASRKGVSNSS